MKALGCSLWADHLWIDGQDQFLQITKVTTAGLALGTVTEESLDHIHPRGAGQCEVNMEAPGTATKPAPDLRDVCAWHSYQERVDLLVVRRGVNHSGSFF
jgi:hypothetical protein